MTIMVCIAGKNQIAVKCAHFIRANHPELPLLIVPNQSDPGYDTWQPSLLKWAKDEGVPCVKLEDICKIKGLVFISLEFDKLIQPEMFLSRRLFNIHFSLLPAYKGAYTSIWPILDGKDTSGVTLHEIDSGIDTGNIIAQKEIPIEPNDTSEELYLKYLENGFAIFKEWFHRLVVSNYVSVPQTVSGSTFYSRKSLCLAQPTVDLKQTAQTIHNQIRAFAFKSYQLPFVKGFKISRSQITNSRSLNKWGQVLSEDNCAMLISTIDFNIRVIKDKFCLLLDACKNCSEFDKICPTFGVEETIRRSPQGWTPLIVASYHGNTVAVRTLLEMGADPNVANYKGTTPIMYAMTPAAVTNDYSVLRLLLEFGVNVKHRDCYGYTAEDYALKNGWLKLVEFLRSPGM